MGIITQWGTKRSTSIVCGLKVALLLFLGTEITFLCGGATNVCGAKGGTINL